MSVTIKDVAALSGVSIATVSKCINGIHISDENNQKIREVIDQLEYKINYSAQGLKTNKSKTIGILIPTLSSLFATQLACYMEAVLQQNGYNSIICDYKKDKRIEYEKLEFLLGKNIDGLVITPFDEFEDYDVFVKPLFDKKIPFIIFDKYFENIQCDCVMLKNIDVCYNATKYLIKNGHKKIAVIVGYKDSMTTTERLQGYIKALNEYNIPVDKKLIFYGSARGQSRSGKHLMLKILNTEDRPTAVFVTNYEMTLGAVIALNEKNLTMYEDISVIGFDDLKLSEIVRPKLTIVVQPMKSMAEMVVNVLMRRIKGDYSDFPIKARVKGTLQLGNSVKNIVINRKEV